MSLELVLFDLDGTLVDTAPDLIPVVNGMRADRGLPALPEAPIREQVSNGTAALLRLALGVGRADPAYPALHQEMLERYRAGIACHSRLFPGMEQVLERLAHWNLPWGVVTNKPGFLTRPLLDALGLLGDASSVISGDTTPFSKPRPEPLLAACEEAGSDPAAAVYVGDARRDIEAGRRAGMRTVLALFGYLPTDADPSTWGADRLIASPPELIPWLARISHRNPD